MKQNIKSVHSKKNVIGNKTFLEDEALKAHYSDIAKIEMLQKNLVE